MIKWLGLLLLFCCGICPVAFPQTLQLHYDARHTLDPKHNSRNFTTLYFEYFNEMDSGKYFIKPGSFLLKMQADFLGQDDNMGTFSFGTKINMYYHVLITDNLFQACPTIAVRCKI